MKLTYRYSCSDCNAQYKFKLTALEARQYFPCNYCNNSFITYNLKTNNKLLHKIVSFIYKCTYYKG